MIVLGCGGPGQPAPLAPIPTRATTAGDRLLGYLPAGADLIVEIDLARLRNNPTVGPVFEAIGQGASRRGDAADWVFLGLGAELLRYTDSLLLASFAVGSDAAESIVLARGNGLAARAVGGHRIDDETVAIGPPGLLARLRSDGAAAGADRELSILRTVAMPDKAGGAAIRVTARLGFEARVELASRFELDAVPATLSLWADVADDLAVVALLGGEPGEAAELVRAARRGKRRLFRSRAFRALSLGGLGDAVEIGAVEGTVRVVCVVRPRRLARVMGHLAARLSGARPRAPGASAPVPSGGGL